MAYLAVKRKTSTAGTGVATAPLMVTSDMRDLTLFVVGTATLQYTASTAEAITAGTATWVNFPASWVADGVAKLVGVSLVAVRANSGAAASGFTAVWKD